MINYEMGNKEIEEWHNDVKRKIRNNIKAKTKHRLQASSPRPLAQRIGGKTFKKFGFIERMNITFPKHLIFREKKVGKGRPAGSQTPDPIVNPIIEQNFEALADAVGNALGNVVMRNVFID